MCCAVCSVQCPGSPEGPPSQLGGLSGPSLSSSFAWWPISQPWDGIRTQVSWSPQSLKARSVRPNIVLLSFTRNVQLGGQHEEDGADGGDGGDALPGHMPLLYSHPSYFEVDIFILNRCSPASISLYNRKSGRKLKRSEIDSLICQTSPEPSATETPVRSRREMRRAQREQGMTIMVGVILVSYLLCTLPAIIVQEFHSRGKNFEKVRRRRALLSLFYPNILSIQLALHIFFMLCRFWSFSNLLLIAFLYKWPFSKRLTYPPTPSTGWQRYSTPSSISCAIQPLGMIHR